ncbi:MAG TPA: phosphopantetheine-binding protein [Blastocatellia bacterium]|nr:phosphopantetheine-binding protein [Blastocatellia bacterium]
MNNYWADPVEVLSYLDSSRRPRPEQEVALVPPRNKTEDTLAAIWAEVLGFQEIGIDDDFFLLGGDSILMTMIISRIHERFGLELSFGDFFDNPTITTFAPLLLKNNHVE